MGTSSLTLAFCSAVLVGLCLGLWGQQAARSLIRLRFVAKPRPWEFHHQPGSNIPRLGGFGIALVLIVAEILLLLLRPSSEAVPVLLICLLFFALGAWDDLRPLGAKRKLVGQCVISVLAWACDLHIETLRFGSWEINDPLLLFFATLVWLVALPNLINLIDGSDGVAAGISLIGLWVIAIVGNAVELWLLVGAISGAILGFLRYNWPPARIYLGDGGAYLLGSLLGVFSVWRHSKTDLVVSLGGCVFVLGLPIADMLYTISRRAWNGLPLFRADRHHLHHRLQRVGLSRRRLALFTYAVTACFALIAVFVLPGGPRGLVVGALLVGAGLAWVFRYVEVRPALGSLRTWRTQLQSRRRVRLALALGRWLVRESFHSRSVNEMLENLHLVGVRLGFKDVLVLRNDHPVASRPGLFTIDVSGAEPQQRLVFFAPRDRFTSQGAMVIADVIAEAWLKAHRVSWPDPKPDSAPTAWIPVRVAGVSRSSARQSAKQESLTIPAL
jgi:UDP-GlcNAc:undecaprenyl-phosphate GlcNAc-1-phosphate transferase